MFNLLNINANTIADIGRRGIREHVKTLARYEERATGFEVNIRETDR